MKMAAMVCRPTKSSNYLSSRYDYYLMISNFYNSILPAAGEWKSPGLHTPIIGLLL
jgi:hypothetical protein